MKSDLPSLPPIRIGQKGPIRRACFQSACV
jgi:hypothetical protein